MGIVSDCCVHVAALGAGLLGVCLGNGGGAVDASIGAAGLIGFVLGQNAQFGPECARIRADIENDVRKKYAARKGSAEEADIEAAAEALKDSLGKCVIDRAALAKTAVTPEGFPKAAIRHILIGLASSNPEFFGERAKRDSALTFRFAQDMVEAAITSAIGNRKYYEQLEPHLMLEMASALGRVEHEQKQHRALLEQILAAVSKTPEKRQAEEAGVTGEQFRALAETALKKATTAQDALDYFTSLIDFAKKEAKARKQPRNIDEFLQRVLDRAAKFIEKSQREKADAEYAKALAQIEDEVENTKQRKRVVLDRAIANDILRLDLESAASRICTRTALDLREGISLFSELRHTWKDWYENGLRKGQKLDIEISVALAKQIVAIAQNKVERGAALNDLGISLTILGERGMGYIASDALAEAIVAFKKSVLERVRKDMPLGWAATNNNLGYAYRTLGLRLEGSEATNCFNLAIAAIKNALNVYTKKSNPFNWAMAQNNLGNMFATKGERGAGRPAVISLVKALDAYTHAAKIRTYKNWPTEWAGTQSNFGNVYRVLAERGQTKTAPLYLAKSVAAYKNALKVCTKKDMPAQWAMTQNNIGNVYLTLGQRGEGKAAKKALAKAMVAYENALEVRTHKEMPSQWAMTCENMAIVYLTMVEKLVTQTPDETLRKAKLSAIDALTVYEQPGMEFYLGKARQLLFDIEAKMAELK